MLKEYKFVKVVKLTDKSEKKKYKAVFKNRTTGREKGVKFGAKGYEDYTIHKDPERKKLYIARHSGMGEDWKDPLTAGYWSRWLLWNKPSFSASLKDVKGKLKNSGYL